MSGANASFLTNMILASWKLEQLMIPHICMIIDIFASLVNFLYVTGFGITNRWFGQNSFFFPEKASTKFKYCLHKIRELYIALFSHYDSK